MEDMEFLTGHVADVAPQLLGCVLERELSGRVLRGRIVEVEAYDQTDAASHSYRGKTERTADDEEIEQAVEEECRNLKLGDFAVRLILHDRVGEALAKCWPGFVGDLHATNERHELVGDLAGKFGGIGIVFDDGEDGEVDTFGMKQSVGQAGMGCTLVERCASEHQLRYKVWAARSNFDSYDAAHRVTGDERVFHAE